MVKLYKITHKFDISIIIKIALKKILEFIVLLILYIDLKSLYNCLVNLGTTQEELLMVIVMSLC